MSRVTHFLMVSSFFKFKYCNCSRSVLANNCRLCTQLTASACKICMRLASSRMPSGRQWHANCTRMAGSPMHISVHFLHVPCDWRPRGYNLNVTVATRVQVACDWWSLVTRQETSRQEVFKRPSLHHYYIVLALASPHPRRMLPTIRYLVWKMRWYYGWHIATRKQILHALAASCVQSRQCFASTLPEPLFE